MIIGTGCNVPGVMSTRTLENKKDRMIAILINPFMSCGARLPIYMVFIAAFFPKHGGLVLFSLYAIGIIVALTMGKIFSKVFRGEESFFIMELPPYRMPTIKGIPLYVGAGIILVHSTMTVIFCGQPPMDPIHTTLWWNPIGGQIWEQVALSHQSLYCQFGTWQASVDLCRDCKKEAGRNLGIIGRVKRVPLITSIQGVFYP